jgi:hypothetical protein
MTGHSPRRVCATRQDHHKIQKWISSGWLRNGFQGTNRHGGNDHDIHRFQEKDILGFIKQHPQEISLGRVDQVWFLGLVLLKGLAYMQGCVAGI